MGESVRGYHAAVPARRRSSRRQTAARKRKAAPQPDCWVYVLRCRDGSLYTGAAKNVQARLRQHQAGRAARYTRSRLPVSLAWSRPCASWSAALRAEARLKRLRRAQKDALLAGALVLDLD